MKLSEVKLEKKADWIEVRCDITSTIHFLDGHTEPGPSTSFESTIRTGEASRRLFKLVGEAHSRMMARPALAGFISELRQVIVPGDDRQRKYVKLRTTFHTVVNGVICWNDGRRLPVQETFERTVPL